MNSRYYVNVFRDRLGNIHYSTEEFPFYRQGILTFAEALEDAGELSSLLDWHYVCTLGSDTHVTMAIRNQIDRAEELIYRPTP